MVESSVPLFVQHQTAEAGNRTMIICADDYGLREDINRAILDLCQAGRLTAVSCMALLERCDTACASEVLALQARVDIGLHLCFTDEGLPLSTPLNDAAPGPRERHSQPARLPSFKALLWRSLSGSLTVPDRVHQISAQYNLFLEKFARAPDFMDGHLHAHQLPGAREALIEFVLRLPPGSRPYIRSTRMNLHTLRRHRLPWLKAAWIGAFGAWMSRRLGAAGLRTNGSLAGIYSFASWQRYEQYLPRFIECLPQPNDILVVHPGLDEDWRRNEFSTLRQFAFRQGLLNRFQTS